MVAPHQDLGPPGLAAWVKPSWEPRQMFPSLSDFSFHDFLQLCILDMKNHFKKSWVQRQTSPISCDRFS